MTTPPHSSLREGEVGGVPTTPASAPSGNHEHRRSAPGQPGNVKIGKGVLQVELPRETVENMKEAAGAVAASAAHKAMDVCKAALKNGKEAHPHAEKTPIRFGMCSKHESPAPVVQDHRPPAPKGQQH